MTAYFGLDIGSSSIKVAQSSVMGTKGFALDAIGLVVNTAGSIDFSSPMVVEKLKTNVKQLLTEAKIREKRVVLAAAESKVYSRILTMPMMSEAELASAIKWEAEQFVPVPVADVELDFSIIQNNLPGEEKKMLVYMVAAPKKYLQSMVDFVTGIGLEPIAIESEMVAVTRALTFGAITPTTLILNIGAMSSVLSIVDGNTLTFSYVIESGGVAMTRALSQSLALPLPQAEEYKRTYGLDQSQLEGKVRTGLLLVMDTIVAEMRKAMEYHLSTRKTSVTRIVLSGGGAYLPALATHLSATFGGIEVLLADPFATAKPARGVVIPRERAVYAVAIGLSQRIF